MAYTEASKRATRKYQERAYDRLEIKVYKGEKAALQAHAATQGESLNAFVNRAVRETVQRDTEV